MAFIPLITTALSALGAAAGATAATATVTGAMLASTGVSAIGALASAKAQSNQLRSQAYADEYNATVASQNAMVANSEATAREEAQRRQFGQLQGQALNAAGVSGAGFDGSNADVLNQNALNAEMDALTIRYEGANKARGLMAQSDMSRYSASTNRIAARDAMQAGVINAGATILSGGSNAYGVGQGLMRTR